MTRAAGKSGAPRANCLDSPHVIRMDGAALAILRMRRRLDPKHMRGLQRMTGEASHKLATYRNFATA